jgi:hypothetical protein
MAIELYIMILLEQQKIVYSCAVLHNMYLAHNVPLPDDGALNIQPDSRNDTQGKSENKNIFLLLKS